MINAILQLNINPFLFVSRMVFCVVIFFTIVRTFEFMRIFILYSPVVQMIFSVINGLMPFLFMFFLFSMQCVLLVSLFSFDFSGLFKAEGQLPN